MDELAQDLNSSPAQTLLCFQETKLQRKTFFTDGSEFETFCLVAGQGHDVPAAGYSGVSSYLERTIIGVPSSGLRVEERFDGCLWAVKAVSECLGLGESFRSSIGPLSEDEMSEYIMPVARTVLDFEGRCLTLRLSCGLFIVNFYGVAFGGNSTGEDRLVKKMYSQVALECVIEACRRRSGSTGVMIVGDFNSVHRRMEDRARAVAEAEACDDDRPSWIRWLCENFDLQDTWLVKNLDLKDVYTCWNQMTGARVTNYGSRIDLILASSSMEVIDATAHTHVLGSDHCPISATFALKGPFSKDEQESVGVDHAQHRQMRLLEFMPDQTKRLRTASKTINSSSPDALVRAKRIEAHTSEDEKNIESPNKWLDNVKYLSKEQQKAYIDTVEFAPKCYKHKLPCILRTVVNKKRNLGRKFWVCCLPDGSGGGSRCNYFAWHNTAASSS